MSEQNEHPNPNSIYIYDGKIIPNHIDTKTITTIDIQSDFIGHDDPNKPKISHLLTLNKATSITFSTTTLKSIPQYTFYEFKSLASIDIPESVKTIGDGAFFNCILLTSVTMPGAIRIGNYAFYGCIELTSIEIPTTVKFIGNYAFNRCSSLPKIEIPMGVVSIESYTFYECTALSEVIIPNSVTYIKERAFMNCTALTTVIGIKNVTEIDSSAFENCGNLDVKTLAHIKEIQSNMVPIGGSRRKKRSSTKIKKRKSTKRKITKRKPTKRKPTKTSRKKKRKKPTKKSKKK